MRKCVQSSSMRVFRVNKFCLHLGKGDTTDGATNSAADTASNRPAYATTNGKSDVQSLRAAYSATVKPTYDRAH